MCVALAFIGMPGPAEMIFILAIAVLLFGKRLPEVGRSLGKGLMEFKKGVGDIESEIEAATSSTGGEISHEHADDAEDDRDEATAPKFEPPESEPKPEEAEG